jgi:ferredoxin
MGVVRMATTPGKKPMLILLDPAENFHPYECDGPGRCVHCDRRMEVGHNPGTCALCQGDDYMTGADLHPDVA